MADTRKTSAAAAVPFWNDAPDLWDTVVIAGVALPGLARVGGKGIQKRIDAKHTPGQEGETTTHAGYEGAEIDITLLLWLNEHLQAFARLIPLLKPPKSRTVRVAQSGVLSSGAVDPFAAARLNASNPDDPGFVQGIKALGAVGSGGGFLADTVGAGKAFAGEPGDVGFLKGMLGAASTSKTIHPPEAVTIYHPAIAMFGIKSVHVVNVSFLERQHDKDIYEVKLMCREFKRGGVAVHTPVAAKSIAALDKPGATPTPTPPRPSAVNGSP